MLDQGGAQIREAERRAEDAWWWDRVRAKLDETSVDKVPSVTVAVTETHDGAPCDCIDKRLTLIVGQELELTHTCHDGRVDKVVAQVVSIDTPLEPEHGKAEAR